MLAPSLNESSRVISACLVGLAALIVAPGASAQGIPDYRLSGPSNVDLAGCHQETPTAGTTTATFWVLRGPTVTGPTAVEISGAPPGVMASVSPATLTYPGWITGQQVTVSLAGPVGAAVPDSVLTIKASDAKSSASAQVLVHGTCPRNSKAFTIKGSFHSNNLGVVYPVEGAIIEIRRDESFAVDPWVAVTTTRADGRFEASVWTNVAGTYYAKLRLNDGAGVYLRNWWDSSIESYNSFNRGSNEGQPLIDLGATLVSRDGGRGTPKTSIWQGSRTAYQEFVTSTGSRPPTGDYEIVIQSTASGIVWTARSTTNWEDNYQTYRYSGAHSGPPTTAYVDLFDTYSTNFHEFGHALRHSVDGDQAHFLGDAARWTYARAHELCTNTAGYVATEGYGFNEGWADYWERAEVGRCVGLEATNITIEGSVAADLEGLATVLTGCLPLAGTDEAIVRAQRRNMFAVLNRGSNIIHSQGEFRSNFTQQFPGCAPGPIGAAVRHVPLRAAEQVYRPDPSRFAKYYGEQIDFRLRERQRLASAAAQAAEQARRVRCRLPNCRDVIAATVRPHMLRAQSRYSDLVAAGFRTRLEEERARPAAEAFADATRERDAARRAALRRQASSIVREALQRSADALDAVGRSQRRRELANAANDVRRVIRRLALQSANDSEALDILTLEHGPIDDQTSALMR